MTIYFNMYYVVFYIKSLFSYLNTIINYKIGSFKYNNFIYLSMIIIIIIIIFIIKYIKLLYSHLSNQLLVL